MAAAFVARKMGVPATIVVPSSSPQLVVQRLQDQGATVKIIGKVTYFEPRVALIHLAVLQVNVFSISLKNSTGFHQQSATDTSCSGKTRPGRRSYYES